MLGTTRIDTEAVAGSAVAVTTAVPGASAWTCPSGVTDATLALPDVKLTGSVRASLSRLHTEPTRVTRAPTGRTSVAGRSSIRLGGPGITRTRTFAVVRLNPGAVASATTSTAPRYPPRTRPVESTLPLKPPPTQITRAPGTPRRPNRGL